MYSAVLILPKEHKEAGDQIGEVMGWGPVSYTIPLSTGQDLTHYGLRADVETTFVDMIEDAKRGTYPSNLHIEALQSVISALIADFSPDSTDSEKPVMWGAEHFEYVCDKYRLVRC